MKRSLEQIALKENHLSCAHRLWKEHLIKGANAIDATCGRGSDLLLLIDYLLSSPPFQSNIFVYDIQEKALQIAKRRAEKELCPEQLAQISWNQRCHSQIGAIERQIPISLIVYNLGYLPGGDKGLTSCAETTDTSLRRAADLLEPRGAISAMCYPGHFAGMRESQQVQTFAAHLVASGWRGRKFRHPDAPLAPFLIWLEKMSNEPKLTY